MNHIASTHVLATKYRIQYIQKYLQAFNNSQICDG